MKHDTELICFFRANDSHWNISIKMNDSLRHMFYSSPVQSNAALLANNSQHCWMLHVASVCTPCCMLLRVLGSRCSKSETGQTFEPTTPNISFVLTLLGVGCIRLHTTANMDATTPNIVGLVRSLKDKTDVKDVFTLAPNVPCPNNYSK